MTMILKRDADSNEYCGPAALALLTGEHVDTCTKAIQAYRLNKKLVRNVFTSEMIAVLHQMGFITARKMLLSATPTLAAVLHLLKSRGPEDKYLILTTGHFIVLRGRKIYDNFNPDGIFVRQYPHRRRRVKSVHLVAKR